MRTTVPIVSRGKTLGALSIGKKIDFLPETMKEVTGNNAVLLYVKNEAKGMAKEFYKEFLRGKEEIGDYIFAEHTLDIDRGIIERLDLSKTFQETKIERSNYIVNNIPIYDFNKKNIGSLLTIHDPKRIYQEFYFNMLKNLLLIVAVFTIIYLVLSSKITDILKEVRKIKIVADNLKEKRFEILEQLGSYKVSSSSDELSSLFSDVIEMGHSLKKMTRELEKEVVYAVNRADISDKIMLHQSKLAFMGEMVDTIAHQWKQPINIIAMKVDICEEDYRYDQIDLKYIQDLKRDINKQIKHMVVTLDEFRGFLRPDKKPKVFNIKSSIDSVLLLMKHEIMKNFITVDTKCSETIEVLAIENEFKHVLINLINNSKDAFNEREIIAREINIIGKESKEGVSITIEDNAGGIKEEVIKKIFKTNFTTKEETKGSGIGLYISKLIVEKVGGTIEAENSDKGVVFSIFRECNKFCVNT